MKLFKSGLYRTTINGIQVAVASREFPPFPVEVMVFEEDTNLILTVDPVIEYEDEHIIRTMTGIMMSKNHKPGSVIVNGSSWYAVVIDLDRELICREQWCAEVFEQIFELTALNNIYSLALPVLGTIHGGLQLEKQLQYILERISSMKPYCLEHLWIVVSCDEIRRAKEIIKMSAMI